jgi:hypothetical protein
MKLTNPSVWSLLVSTVATSSLWCWPTAAALNVDNHDNNHHDNNHDLGTARRLKRIRAVGDNGNPKSAFPLGLCEGECDRDSDCQGKLRCFQRSGGQAVPGCKGGEDLDARSDFCYDPDSVPSAPVPAPVRAPVPAPVQAPVPVPSTTVVVTVPGRVPAPAPSFTRAREPVPIGALTHPPADRPPLVHLKDRPTAAPVSAPVPAPVSAPVQAPVPAPVPTPVAAPRPEPFISQIARNESPPSIFPLGLCQGDCDRDSDCAPGLRCFQRDSRQAVPGCRGGEQNTGNGDFCYDPNPQSGSVPTAPTPTGPSPTPPAPTAPTGPSPTAPTTPGAITTETFVLKLYWEEGYFWQEESFERRWCVRCRNRCSRGGLLKIVNCDNDGGDGEPDRFRFLTPANNNQVQLQEVSSELCLERTGNRKLTMERCRSNRTNQRFQASNGNLVFGDKFELTPVTRLDFCVTQRHHPKADEVLELEPCDLTATFSDTSFWNLE